MKHTQQRRRSFPLALTIAGFAFAAIGPAAAQTTIYIVRHAEKANEPGDNPPLSDVGHKRAALLAAVLRSVKLDAAYSTDYQRTKDTVAPAAHAAGVGVTDYKSERELAEQFKAGTAGRRVLVAGHSNTVPRLLEALGVSEPIKLADADYDNLFIVVIGKSGDVTFQHLHYGTDLK